LAAAVSPASAVWYATAPCEATTRTVMPADPEPKDARTAGAHARSRLVPNSARTAPVSTTTTELRGSRETGPSTSRGPAADRGGGDLPAGGPVLFPGRRHRTLGDD